MVSCCGEVSETLALSKARHELQSLANYWKRKLTVTFHPLVDQSVEQGPTVITEGRASIRVDFELVLASRVLKEKEQHSFQA